MSTRTLAVSAVAAVLAAHAAHAVDVTGAIGAGYSRGDVKTSLDSTSTPAWDALGSLNVSGTPFNPDLLSFQGSGSYQTRHDLYTGASSRSQGFGFQLSAGALTASSFPMSFGASRGVTDFTSDLASQRTGSTLTTGYAGTLLYQTEGRPTLTFGASHTDNVNSSFGQPDREDVTTIVRVGARQTLQSLAYALNYDTGWSAGTFADTNYRTHNFRGEASAALSRDVDIRFNDTYTLRDPRVTATSNPRLESHSIGSGMGFGLSGEVTSRVDYSYTRALIQGGDAADQDSLNHGLSYTASWRTTDALTLIGGLTGSLADERIGGSPPVRSTAEAVTFGATWMLGSPTALRTQLDGNASVGLSQPRGAPSQGAYGAGGGITFGMGLWGWNGSIGYHGSYSDGITAGSLRGFSHGLTLNADGTPWRSGSLHATVTAQSSRRDDVVIGTVMDRNVSAQVRTSWSTLSWELNAGLAEGLTAALRNPAFADGLLISPGYDAHTRFAGLTMAWAAARRLSVSGTLRGLDSASPGRPDSYELGASLAVGYFIGEFQVQLQDQISEGGANGSWQRANLFMARILRSFGTRLF
ncbi:MAG TPA: hypothetical protein VFP65_17090 [Anaeromyxobacteraceae bacterium]|nr:hypothetical protein [Anaeromyxobacteraceae bacterium]